MGWYRVADGCLRYRGPTREPFAAWLKTAAGAEAVADLTPRLRFSLLGRTRAARRLLWRHVESTLGDSRVRAIVHDHARIYPSLLASLAFVEALPRATVDLRRIVIVPRLLLDARAYEMVQQDLARLVEPNEMGGGEALWRFLVTALVDEMDRACAAASPTVGRPLLAGDDWASVRMDLHFTWDTPDWSGPSWPGHHYVYERPRTGLTIGQRRRLKAAMEELSETVARWSRARRHEVLQRAQRAAQSQCA